MVAQVLQQAATVTANAEGPYEMLEYVISLREGIMDAWGGIILAMKGSSKSESQGGVGDPAADARTASVLQAYVEPIFQLLNIVWQDQNRSESLLRSSMGVIGCVSRAL